MPPTTRVGLPTDLPNWPELKRLLTTLKRSEPRTDPAALARALDQLHAAFLANYPGGGGAATSAVGRSSFSGLRRFLERCPTDAQRRRVLDCLVPFAVDRVLALEGNGQTLNYSLQQDASVTVLSREFVSSLLAAAMLCLMPHHPSDLAASMSDNSFSALYAGMQNATPHQAEKLQCILSYFDQLERDGPPKGRLVIARSVLPPEEALTPQQLAGSSRPLCRLLVEPEGSLDTADCGLLHVCFGNSFLGGGVLWTGVLQEEHLFVRHPELMASMLFVEAMDNNEAVHILGHEPFSRTDGHGLQIKFSGQLRDFRAPDAGGLQPRALVSMDAVPFRGFPNEQYVELNLLREANKAFVAFRQSFKQCPELSGYRPRGVATGNWGCGAFGGDPQLKSLLQWLVASQLELPVLQYHKFGDSRVSRLEEVAERLRQAKVTVGRLWQRVLAYCDLAREEYEKTEALQTELFAHLLKNL